MHLPLRLLSFPQETLSPSTNVAKLDLGSKGHCIPTNFVETDGYSEGTEYPMAYFKSVPLVKKKAVADFYITYSNYIL